MAEITTEEKYKRVLKIIRGWNSSQSWTSEAIFKSIHKMIDEVIPYVTPRDIEPPLSKPDGPVIDAPRVPSELPDPDVRVLVNRV